MTTGSDTPRGEAAIRKDHDPFWFLHFLFFLRWTSYLCPYCLEAFRRDSWPHNVRLGSGERICGSCGKIFDDGAREWPELLIAKKFRCFFPPGIVAMCVSFLLVGIGALLVAPRDQVNWLMVLIVLSVFLSPTLAWCLIRFFLVRRSIGRYENDLASLRRRLEFTGS